MFPHPGVTWVSRRLTPLCGYTGAMKTRVLQVAWISQRPISSSGNLSALEMCPVDPRRAQTLLFLRPLICAHTVMLPHSSHILALPPSFCQLRGWRERGPFRYSLLTGAEVGSQEWGWVEGPLHTWCAGTAPASHSSAATRQVARRNLGPKRECEVVR